MRPAHLCLYLLRALDFLRAASAASRLDGAWKATSRTCSGMARTLLRVWRAMMRNLIDSGEVAA